MGLEGGEDRAVSCHPPLPVHPSGSPSKPHLWHRPLPDTRQSLGVDGGQCVALRGPRQGPGRLVQFRKRDLLLGCGLRGGETKEWDWRTAEREMP